METTTAADVAGVSNEKHVCSLGKGAVISFMDRGTIYDRAYYDLALDTAREEQLPCQIKQAVAGGNDAGPFMLPVTVCAYHCGIVGLQIFAFCGRTNSAGRFSLC